MLEPHIRTRLDLDGASRRAGSGSPARCTSLRVGRWHLEISCHEEPAALDALGKMAARDANDPLVSTGDLEWVGRSGIAGILVHCGIGVPLAPGRTQMLAQASAISGGSSGVPTELSSLMEMIGSRGSKSHEVRTCPVHRRTDDAGRPRRRTGEVGTAVTPHHRGAAAGSEPGLDRLAPLWPSALALAVSSRSGAERFVALDVRHADGLTWPRRSSPACSP